MSVAWTAADGPARLSAEVRVRRPGSALRGALEAWCREVEAIVEAQERAQEAVR